MSYDYSLEQSVYEKILSDYMVSKRFESPIPTSIESLTKRLKVTEDELLVVIENLMLREAIKSYSCKCKEMCVCIESTEFTINKKLSEFEHIYARFEHQINLSYEKEGVA